MAHRPRRPSGGKPETVIDGEAERRPPAVTGGAAESVSGETGDASAPGAIAADRTTFEPFAADQPAVGETGPVGTDPSEPRIAVEEPAAADVPPLVGVSDVEAEPNPTDPNASRPAAEAAFAREEGFAGETAADIHPADGPSDPVPANDPVLAAAVPAASRRDLGEFEDDEPGAEPHRKAAPAPTAPYTAPHESEGRGTSFASLLGAALLGALIVGAGGVALLRTGAVTLPGSGTPAINPQQFAAAGEVQQINGDLQTLRGTVEQLQSAQAAGGAGAGVSPADFTALTDRVSANERAIQSGGDASGNASNAAQGAADAAQGAQSTADGAREAATAAQGAADAARTAADEARTTAQGAVDTAQGARDAAQAAQNTAGEAKSVADEVQGAVATVRGEVSAFGERLTAIEAANQRAAQALAAAGLKAAIDRGTPFMGELERFASSSDEAAAEAVGSLRDYAAAGVPTLQSLSARWNDAETAILDALRPPVSPSDVGDQVLSGLRSLVTVRPTGTAAPAGTEGPAQTVARMDAFVTTGDLAGWVREWETLPEAARNASMRFAEEVRARAEADRLIDQTINSAIGASASQG